MRKLTEFDAAEYLNTIESQNAYLEEVSKENDPAELLKAIDTISRARGMSKMAKEVGITREGLYKALSADGNPSFATVYKILNVLGYTFSATPIVKCGY